MEMDDDSDDCSSSPPETLDQFREKWQKELTTTKRCKENKTIEKTTNCNQSDSNNDQVIWHFENFNELIWLNGLMDWLISLQFIG